MRTLVLLALAGAVLAAEPKASTGPFGWAIGEAGNASRHAYYPVRIRNLERVAWRFSEGAHSGFACPGKDGVVRIQGGGGHIRGVDARTGQRLWVAGGVPRFFNYSSCVTGPDGSAYGGNHTVLCAVGKDGKERWRVDLGASWIHYPPAVSPDGKTVFIGGDALGLAALDSATGKVRWLRREFRSSSSTYCFDEIGNLVVNLQGSIVSFDKRGGEVWRIPGHHGSIMIVGNDLITWKGNAVLSYDRSTRKIRWGRDLQGAVTGVAYSDRGRIVATTAAGHVVAIERDGVVRWDVAVSKKKLNAPVATAGGEILVMDKTGMLLHLDGRGRVLQEVNTGLEPYRWRPTVGPDGSVYVNHRDAVVKYTGSERAPAVPLVATEMIAVADDFVVDVWVNGRKVPLSRRKLLVEVHGASTERIRADLHPGDWVVFHVVANRLRWGGSSYLGVLGRGPWGRVGFVSTTKGNWSYCDDPSEAAEFVAKRDVGADRPAKKPARPWGGAAAIWRNTTGSDFPGEPVWGTAPSTWVKFIVPKPR